VAKILAMQLTPLAIFNDINGLIKVRNLRTALDP